MGVVKQSVVTERESTSDEAWRAKTRPDLYQVRVQLANATHPTATTFTAWKPETVLNNDGTSVRAHTTPITFTGLTGPAVPTTLQWRVISEAELADFNAERVRRCDRGACDTCFEKYAPVRQGEYRADYVRWGSTPGALHAPAHQWRSTVVAHRMRAWQSLPACSGRARTSLRFRISISSPSSTRPARKA